MADNPFSFLGSRWDTSNINPQTGSAYVTASTPLAPPAAQPTDITTGQNPLLQMLLPLLLSNYLGQQGQVPNVVDYSQSGGQTPGAVASPPAVLTNTQANPFSFIGSRFNTSNRNPLTGSDYTTAPSPVAPSPVLNGGSISPMLTGNLTQTQMLTQAFQKLLSGILGGQRPPTSSGSASPAPTTVTQPPSVYTPPATLTTQTNPLSFLGSRWNTSNINPQTGSAYGTPSGTNNLYAPSYSSFGAVTPYV